MCEFNQSINQRDMPHLLNYCVVSGAAFVVVTFTTTTLVSSDIVNFIPPLNSIFQATEILIFVDC